MPRPADLVINLPFLFIWADCSYYANDFMARNAREAIAINRQSVAPREQLQGQGSNLHVPKHALCDPNVGVADTASLNFDQDLASLGLIDRNLFDCPWCVGFLEDDGAAGFGDAWCHCDCFCFDLKSTAGQTWSY